MTRSVSAVRERPPDSKTTDEVDDDPIEGTVTAFATIIAAHRRRLARVWRDPSISKLNLHLLILLGIGEPPSMGELAEQAGVSLPNLTGTITRMETLGLVKRVPSVEDRRRVLVGLTAKGRGAVEQIESTRRAEIRHLVQRLSPSEQAICFQAMQALARVASETESTTD